MAREEVDKVEVSVITDSAAGLTADDIGDLDITVLPLYVLDSGETSRDSQIDLLALHGRVASGPLEGVTTSQPTREDVSAAFSRASEGGHAVLGVFMSSLLSSTFQAAQAAAEAMQRDNAGARVALVDTRSNSAQEGFAVLAAAECAATGGDLAECERAARASMERSRYLFAPSGLDHLAHGGRIFGAAALVGSALRIAPVLTASGGTTGIAGVVRTRRQALARMANVMRADVERFGIRRAAVQAVHLFEDARRFAREVIEPIAGMAVPVSPVAATIAIHVGPAIGLAYETVDELGSSPARARERR